MTQVEHDRTPELLERHLDADFSVAPMSPEDEVITPALVADLGRSLGVVFPPAFVAHVCGRFPGIGVEVKESVWPRAELYDVGPAWTFMHGFYTLTPCAASEDWMRIDVVARGLRETGGLVAAPILKVLGDADVYCIDPRGAVCQYDHEEQAPMPFDGDFWDLFEQQLVALKARRDRRRDADAETR